MIIFDEKEERQMVVKKGVNVKEEAKRMVGDHRSRTRLKLVMEFGGMQAHRRASGSTLSGANVEVSATGGTRTKCVTGSRACFMIDQFQGKSIANGIVDI
jgi:hypothetical protein